MTLASNSASVGHVYTPLSELSAALGRKVRIALLERRSRNDEDTKSLEVQHDALVRFLGSLPVGSFECDHAQLAEEGGDVYRQVVSAWKGKGQHKLLQRILVDLAKYDVVLVHRMDRFGRNTLAILTALDAMRDNGVRLYSVQQGLDSSDPAQQFNTGLYALLAQQSSDLSSARIKENKARAKGLGGWRGGAITYGYRKAMTMTADGVLVPVLDRNGYKTLEHDPDEAVHVVAVIGWIVNGGKSVAACVRELNDRRVPSPRGTRTSGDGIVEEIKWSSSGLRRILTNPMLMGYDVVGVGEDRFGILEVDGAPHRPHPPIVEDARWFQLQRCIGTGAESRRRPHREALLAGLVVCEALRVNGQRCGRAMHGPGTITNNSASYTCRTSNNLSKTDPERCTGNAISARCLQRMVELTVLAIAADPRWKAALTREYNQARAAAEAKATHVGLRLATLQRQMTDLRKEREAAKSTTRRAEVNRDIDLLDEEIAALEHVGAVPETVSHVDVDFQARWENMDQGERRALIGDLVEHVDIAPAEKRGEFDATRVRQHLRNVGVLQITEQLQPASSIACPECGEQFPRPAALGVHRRYKHSVVGSTSRRTLGTRVRYECPQDGCGRSFDGAGGIQRHLIRTHGHGSALVCPRDCGTVLLEPADLDAHLRSSHAHTGDVAGQVCLDCGKVLKTWHGLRCHRGRLHPAA